jgi:chromosome segregation ATPase
MAQTLDSVLKLRLRAVLDREPVTEAELRKLAEEGRSCARILGGQLERAERRLGDLSEDGSSSLAEIADALREVNELRPDLDELRSLLDDLDAYARASRAHWLSAP